MSKPVIFNPEVDRLGELRAQIAELQEQAAEIETGLRQSPGTIHEGNLFRCTVGTPGERSTVDWKAIAQKFEPSRQLVTANTKKSETKPRITCSAKLKTPKAA